MVLDRRFFILLILILALGMPASAMESDYVRLHVIADSDSEEAQALKLKVRDAVLLSARAMLADADDADDAWRRVNTHVRTLEIAARARVLAEGFDMPVRCEVGIFDFPDRTYGDTLVPAGEYRAVRVVIGSGRGRNWWCVLFPSLCYPGGQPEDDPVFYSAVWNWLRGLFGGEAA